MAKTAKTEETTKVLVLRTESVAIKSLQMYHANPRVGNVDKIAESLETNGMYKPIVVNIGTKTKRKNEIAAGNHTYLGARRLGWTTILAAFIDVDETTLKRIVLADNKTADSGTYDEAILADLLSSLPDITGTGYVVEDMDAILASVQTDAESSPVVDVDGLLANVRNDDDDAAPTDPREAYRQNRSDEQNDAALSRGASVPVTADTAIDEVDDVPDATAELQVVLELKESNNYMGSNKWHIPDLLPDMLVDKMPPGLTTWGGEEATPDDGKKWFLYNYSLGGVRGLPYDRTVICFYTYDDKFANWWELPAYYTAKFLAKGCKMAVVPDFSYYYTDPRVMHLFGQYRAQWLGRFFQESGMKVIPRIQFDYRDPDSLEIGLLGIPQGAPIVAHSAQNLDDPEDVERSAKHLRAALDHIQPQHLILYGGNPGWRMAEATGWTAGKMHHVMNYSGVRRGTVFDKKDGKKTLTKKQKDAIIEKHTGAKPVRKKVLKDEEREL